MNSQKVSKSNKKKNVKRNKKNEKIYNAPLSVATRKYRKIRAKEDSRVSETRVAPLVPSMATTINQVYNVTSQTLYGTSMYYICAALSNGWLGSTPAPGFPSAAWQYMCSIWATFINGTQDTTKKLPYWMAALGHAITPKEARLGNGTIYYKAQVGQTSGPTTGLFSVQEGFEINLYDPSAGNVDGFPIAVPPSNQDPEKAFLSMIAFFSKLGGESALAHNNRLVFVRDVTSLDNNVSAFSTLQANVGTGSGYYGGIGWLAGLEVPIHTPLLAPALNPVNLEATGAPTRVPKRATWFSGDELSMGMFMLNTPESTWGTKKSPNFKCIDFLYAGNVLANWASLVVSQWYGDPANQTALQFGNTQSVIKETCPLTLQEMLLLLRNEIMSEFSMTQNGVQALQPTITQIPTQKAFVPLLTGTTGAGLQTVGMKLPNIFAENIKSLHLGYDHPDSKDRQYYVPIWGQYQTDALTWSDYKYTIDQGTANEQFVNVFKDPALVPTFQEKKVKSAYVWEKVSQEPVINLIDTSSGNDYVFVNDLGRLKELVALWNEWITKFSAFTSPLTTLDSDGGVNVLYSLNQTRLWYPRTALQSKQEASIGEKVLGFRDERITSRKSLSATPYAEREVVAYSFREAPFDSTFKITGAWILPEFYLRAGAGSADSANFVKIQELYGEAPSISVTSTGFTGQTLASLAFVYASAMVHARDGEGTWDKDFNALSVQGHAGILSSLVASFVGSIAGPEVGSVAKSIASALPI